MFNPNSAIERIKNSLSYKLGLAIIECKNNMSGGGYITLLCKLYKIKQQHFKEQKLYKQTIKIFPQLAYPKVESCKDYNESIKYKYHFSCMLGEALICAHKAWYKGGYFKLVSLLKEKRKLYNNIQETVSILPKKLHYGFYNSIKNHKINIQDLADILKQCKDYKPILENIFHNFDYTLNHLELIKDWLLSDDFYQRYKKENHPYPSLLDPKKLNDENEKINYKNIPAELAWEMNLPLPHNYKFIHLSHFGIAFRAMKILYQNVSLKIITHFSRHDGKQTYIEIFRQLNFCFSYDSVLYLDGFNMMNKNQNRFFLMIDKKVPLVTILRDPIERFLPLVNHLMYNKDAKYEFRLDDDLNNMLNSIRYYDGDNILSCYPNVNNIKTYECGYKSNVNFSLKSRIQYLKNVTKILYIEMDKIIGEDTLKTMKMLSHILGFHIPNSIDRKKFGGKINGGDFLGLIPRKLRITCNDFSEILEKKKDILITISTFQHTPVKFYNITQKILQEKLFNSEIIIFTDTKEDFDIIQRDQKLFNRLNECLKEFVQILEKQIKKENSKRIQLNEILDFFRCNKDVYNYFKKVFDYELQDVKKNNPKLIDKWYTYKEFNKISDSF